MVLSKPLPASLRESLQPTVGRAYSRFSRGAIDSSRHNNRDSAGRKNVHSNHSTSLSNSPIEDSPIKRSSIDELLHRNPSLWRGCDMAGQGFHGRSTGYPKLDDILPGRGWPERGLMEIITPCWGMGELQLLIPLMRSVVEQGKWILWISPPYQLYAPALVQAGIDSKQVLVVKLETSCRDALWSMEKALQTENCGLVLAWQNWLPGKVLRRLQLAADTGNTLGVIYKHRDSEHSPSPIRLQIKDSPATARPSGHFSGKEITVIKARGNFRPLTTRLDLQPQSCPRQQPHLSANCLPDRAATYGV